MEEMTEQMIECLLTKVREFHVEMIAELKATNEILLTNEELNAR
jgi:hypothetical protein